MCVKPWHWHETLKPCTACNPTPHVAPRAMHSSVEQWLAPSNHTDYATLASCGPRSLPTRCCRHPGAGGDRAARRLSRHLHGPPRHLPQQGSPPFPHAHGRPQTVLAAVQAGLLGIYTVLMVRWCHHMAHTRASSPLQPTADVMDARTKGSTHTHTLVWPQHQANAGNPWPAVAVQPSSGWSSDVLHHLLLRRSRWLSGVSRAR